MFLQRLRLLDGGKSHLLDAGKNLDAGENRAASLARELRAVRLTDRCSNEN